MRLRRFILPFFGALFLLMTLVIVLLGSVAVRDEFGERERMARLLTQTVYSRLIHQLRHVEEILPFLLAPSGETAALDVVLLSSLDGGRTGKTFRGPLPAGFRLSEAGYLWATTSLFSPGGEPLLLRLIEDDVASHVVGVHLDLQELFVEDEGSSTLEGMVLCDARGSVLWGLPDDPFVARGAVPPTALRSQPQWGRSPWGELLWGRAYSLPLAGLRLFVYVPLRTFLMGLAGRLYLPALLGLTSLFLLWGFWSIISRQVLDPMERARLVAVEMRDRLDSVRAPADYTTTIEDLSKGMSVFSKDSALEEVTTFGQALASSLQTLVAQQEELVSYSQELESMNVALTETNEIIRQRETLWRSTLEASRVVSYDEENESHLGRIADILLDISDAFGAAIARVDGDDVVLLVERGYAGSPSYDRLPLDDCLAGLAIREKRPLWFADASGEERYKETHSEVKSEFFLPLIHFGRALGVITLSWDERREEDLPLVESLAPLGAFLAGALDVQRSMEELKQSYTYMAGRLQHLTALYHDETAEHVARTDAYCRFLARRLGRSDEEVERIGFFSRLHDIGKLRIPRHILTKSDPLTAAEFELIKSHSLWGAEILGGAEWLAMGRRICLYHHERWDGTGYPKGLAGGEIPWEARIMALADVYDALRSRRSYKEPFCHGKAVQIILEGDDRVRPEHFDPILLEIFREEHDRMDEIFDSYREEDR